jgi:hypothetical protein
MNASAAIADSPLRQEKSKAKYLSAAMRSNAAAQAKLGMAGVLAAQSRDVLFQVRVGPLRLCLGIPPIALLQSNGSDAWRLPGARCAFSATGGT